MLTNLKVDGNLNVIDADNGDNYGRLEDFLVSKSTLATKAFLAVRAYHAEVIESANAIVAAAAVSVKDAQKATADEADVRLAAEQRADAEAARTSAIISALKGVDPAMLPAEVHAELLTADEKKKADLLAQRAELDAKLAAME